MTKFLLIVGVSLLHSGAFAESAKCKIKIEDVKKGTTNTIEEKYNFKKDGPAHRKFFDVPGNDYKCTLAFFDLSSGTMLSCEYKKDGGVTFFQSDRSGVKEAPKTNRLAFRHNSVFISLNAECN